MPEEHPRLEADTLDLLYDLARRAPDAQLRDVDSIDAKVTQVFAAGSVLIGLAALRGTHHHTTAGILLGVAVAVFLYVAYYALRTLWTREFRVLISPEQLWRDYWADPPESIKHAVVADVATGYPENDRLLQDKRRSLRQALIGVGIEAVAIGVALALSTF
jgi:hypothetical protein